jgi:hypothetical protein
MDLWWTKAKVLKTGAGDARCLSCHTAIPYALARPALRRALGEEFADADADADGVLEARELTAYIKESVPRLVQKLKDAKVDGLRAEDTQMPAEFLPRLEQRRPLARK